MNEAQRATGGEEARRTGYGVLAAWLLGGLFLFRLLFAPTLELAGDEAYYWLWSKHPAPAYYSKGPGIAWTIRLGTALFGDTERGIRFPAALLGLAAGALLYRLGARLFDRRTAFWTLAVSATVPIFHVGGLLMTIDPLSVFFWLAAAAVFWRARRGDAAWPWAATGALVGLGMLCKYTNLVQLLCFLLFLAVSPPDRRHLRSGRPWLMVAVALLCLAPVLAWNARHEGVTLRHLTQRGALDRAPRILPAEFAAFVGSQALVLTPLYFLGTAWVLLRGTRRGGDPAPFRYLAALVLPLPLGYGLLSFNGEWEANWTAPALALCPLVLAAGWLPRAAARRSARLAAGCAVGMAGLLTAALLAALATPWAYGDGRFRRLGGARDLAGRVEAERLRHGAAFVVADGYQLAALMAFYLPGGPPVFIPEEDGIRNQFSLWPGYVGRLDGQDAVCVDASDHPHRVLPGQFRRLEPLGETWSVYRGRRMRRYHLWIARELLPAPAPAPH